MFLVVGRPLDGGAERTLAASAAATCCVTRAKLSGVTEIESMAPAAPNRGRLQRELGQIVAADREAVEPLGEDHAGRGLTHHVNLKAPGVTREAMVGHRLERAVGLLHRAAEPES